MLLLVDRSRSRYGEKEEGHVSEFTSIYPHKVIRPKLGSGSWQPKRGTCLLHEMQMLAAEP